MGHNLKKDMNFRHLDIDMDFRQKWILDIEINLEPKAQNPYHSSIR